MPTLTTLRHFMSSPGPDRLHAAAIAAICGFTGAILAVILFYNLAATPLLTFLALMSIAATQSLKLIRHVAAKAPRPPFPLLDTAILATALPSIILTLHHGRFLSLLLGTLTLLGMITTLLAVCPKGEAAAIPTPPTATTPRTNSRRPPDPNTTILD